MSSLPLPQPPAPQPSVPQPAVAVVPRTKPGPKPWASGLQWNYLEEGVPKYCTAQEKKGKKAAISNFLDDFMPGWWLAFPLKGEMTAEVDHKHMKEWFQNHGSAKKTKASTVHINNLFPKPRTCALMVEEMYSQKFYVTWLIKDMMKELFEAESEEVHQMVLHAMKAAPPQIKMFIAALSKATGCTIMTIMGGPDPCQNGKILSYGFHAGEDPQGQTFGQVFPNFKETYLLLFTQFLQSPDVCNARMLKSTSKVPGSSGMNSNDVDSDVNEDASGITGKNDEVARHGHIDDMEEHADKVWSNSANIMPPAEPLSQVSPSPSVPIPPPSNRSASLTPDTVVGMDEMPAQNEWNEEAITHGLNIDGIDGHAKEVQDNLADLTYASTW
ncbi:hypothetical protein EV421DRAFT_1740458 [Armillaria borealis]|uniref:Uncharacterized protein n=1 Tax=Armillaria borealis TaxID=47425 RepID=A0AA39J4A2_9AGAR|nr:hypothetical protein EV421DRAFT_1740458 [Armillaria borealis]